MPKRILKPTRRWNTGNRKENCPNRAVLNPSILPQPMTYRPLGRKTKKTEESDHAASKTIPPQPKDQPSR